MPRVADKAQIEQKRLEIIEGAARCFSRSGLDKATTDEICREAGISPGRLYYYFGSRDDIVVGVVEYIYSVPDKGIEEAFGAESIIVALTGAQQSVAKAFAERGVDQHLLLQIISTAKRHSEIQKIVEAQTKKLRQTIEAYLDNRKQNGDLKAETDVAALTSVLMAVTAGWENLSIADGQFDLATASRNLEAILRPWMATTN